MSYFIYRLCLVNIEGPVWVHSILLQEVPYFIPAIQKVVIPNMLLLKKWYQYMGIGSVIEWHTTLIPVENVVFGCVSRSSQKLLSSNHRPNAIVFPHQIQSKAPLPHLAILGLLVS